MLGLFNDVKKTEEFVKANIYVKTIRVTNKNKIRESMSFPAFNFKELVQESWEDSELRDTLDSTKFFFTIFQEDEEGTYHFRGAKFWSMPSADIEGTVRGVWEETIQTLKDGVRLVYKGSRVYNNFVSKSDNRIIHVRPHANKASYVSGSSDSDQLPTPAQWENKPVEFDDDYMTKQCFWFNNDYVLSQIADLLK